MNRKEKSFATIIIASIMMMFVGNNVLLAFLLTLLITIMFLVYKEA